MRNRLAVYGFVLLGVLVGLAGALIGIFWGRVRPSVVQPSLSPGVAVQPVGDSGAQAELQKAIASAPVRAMNRSGLVAATGGIHVAVSASGPVEVLLPMPQLADGQAPVCFFISVIPADAAESFRLCKRDDSNTVVVARLKPGNLEVRIAWSSVVLLAPHTVAPNTTPAEPYRAASPCAQSGADEIARLAAGLWPKSGKVREFAASIQRHIRQSTRREPPRSLDALGILRSGENTICTANANLAVALLRSKGIACRTVAAIPSNSQRIEMHRIVEFSEDGQWRSFDPGSVYPDIPTRPWQYVIMAKTTVEDESAAMRPRMGAMIGCPYGQEAELLTPGVSLCGQDFFWTLSRPLAEFEPTEESIRLAADAWSRYLETGALTQGQLEAASARTATAFVEALQHR